MNTLFSAVLLAQLGGPWCGQYGTTPETAGSLGCTVPGPGNSNVRLFADPYSPGGIYAEPDVPPRLPVFGTPALQINKIQ